MIALSGIGVFSMKRTKSVVSLMYDSCFLRMGFLERQSRLSDKKAFSSLELYFFRLKKQKGVICGKDDDNITTELH